MSSEIREEEGHRTCAIECGEGWKLLYEPLIERCKAEGVAILQIKEKFGGLRFYIIGGTDELYDSIDEAEAKSFTICERCGAPGVLREGGWMQTLCDEHALARTASDKNSTTCP